MTIPNPLLSKTIAEVYAEMIALQVAQLTDNVDLIVVKDGNVAKVTFANLKAALQTSIATSIDTAISGHEAELDPHPQYAGDPPVLTAASLGYDVWLIAGQSNAAGAATPIDPAFEYIDPRIEQWGLLGNYYNKQIVASDPLKFPEGLTTTLSAGLHFARLFVNTLAPNRKVLLVPAAWGGTGLVGGRWQPGNPGGDLYEQAIAATNLAVTSNPNNVFRGVLFAQGETEADNGTIPGDWITAIDALITGFRSRIVGGVNSLFLVGGMVPSWVGGIARRNAIDAAHKNIPNRIERSWYIPGVINADNTPNGLGIERIHYGADGLRQIGKQYALAVEKAAKNTIGVTPPVPLLVLSNTESNTATLSWATAGSTVPYSYELSFSVNGGAFTVLLANSLKTVYKALNLTLGASYAFRVRSRLVGGYSDYSNIINYTVPTTPVPGVSATPAPFFRCKANEGVLTQNAKVTFIDDVAGNNRFFYQQFDANRPLLSTFAGLPVIETSASTWLWGVDGSFPGINQSYTKFILLRLKDLVSGGGVFIGSPNAADSHVWWRAGTNKQQFSNTPPYTQVVSSTDLVADTWYALFATYNVSNGEGRIYQGGTLKGTATLPNSSSQIMSIFNGFDTNGIGNNAYCLEFGMWNTALSQAQIAAETALLAATYGITIAG